MYSFVKYFCCKEFLTKTILAYLIFVPCFANVDDRSNKTLEARLHSIYEKHYSTAILDADWFKIIDTVQQQTHLVRAGDTLWGISKVYFGDGHYWSKLWSVNQSITNPHLILVGDKVSFTTGNLSEPPQISVEKNESGETSLDLTSADVAQDQLAKGEVDETAAGVTDGEESEDGESAGGSLTSGNSSDQEPADLPDFFKMPFNKFQRATQMTSVVPRPIFKQKTEIMLTQEVLNSRPAVVGKLKSVGDNRVVTAESSKVIIECKDQEPAVGSVLSIIDSDLEEIKNGHVVKVLAVIKVLRHVEKFYYEAAVTAQYDAILNRSLVSTYLPSMVNIEGTGTVKEVPVQVLNANKKSIWSTGDVIFLKTTDTQVSVGDILNFSNKFDESINTFLRAGFVKVVASRDPFATGVVIYSTDVLRENSVSQPMASESSLW